MRKARYRGLIKTRLQHYATAAGINLLSLGRSGLDAHKKKHGNHHSFRYLLNLRRGHSVELTSIIDVSSRRMEFYLHALSCFIKVQGMFCARIEGKHRALVQNIFPDITFLIVATPQASFSLNSVPLPVQIKGQAPAKRKAFILYVMLNSTGQALLRTHVASPASIPTRRAPETIIGADNGT
jgi:hypothetical protein